MATEKKARDGETLGDDAEAKAKELEEALPEPKPMGDRRGTIPLPVGSPPNAKRNVEIAIELTSTHMPGAGQLDINKEHLLIVRAGYSGGTPKPKRDGEGQVVGFKYKQQLKPSWCETLEDYLDLNGLKIVRVDEEGKAIEVDNLVNIEELRGKRKKDSALS
jgi:hypothetical protein